MCDGTIPEKINNVGKREYMKDFFHGELEIIGMRGCKSFTDQVDSYICDWRGHDRDTYVTDAECPRFGTGEAKGLLRETQRGKDVYIIVDCFNYGPETEYKMYGQVNRMSPDDHFSDLKRIIAAIGGKARRISVIMPMLYEGRQHRRSARESLDCAQALHELVAMGVTNIITFDAHDPRVANSIPLAGFDNVQVTYQMIKALVKNVPDVKLKAGSTMMVSPDEGGMSRCMYYSSVLGLELGMFYKRRNYTIIVNGRNPIEAHEFLGNDVSGKDVIIVDDMISSGDSVIDIAYQLKERGAKRIFVFATFGLFCNGLDTMDKAYEDGAISKIFTTNLIYRTPELKARDWYCEVNLCKYVALIIDTLNHDMTISDLLNPVNRIHKLMDKVNKTE